MTLLQRRLLLNLALLLAVLGLVVLVMLEQHQDGPEPDLHVLGLDEAAIHHLRIERPGQPTVVLERQGDNRWQLREPVDIAANTFRVDALLRVSRLQSQGSFPVPADALDDYRLQPPQASLIINDTHRLDFGGHTALDHRRYVRLGDTIHIVPDTLFYHLIGEAYGFVAHQLLPAEARIVTLELPTLHLSREHGQWQVEPSEMLRSADRIQAILDAWLHPGIIQVRRHAGQPGAPIRVTLETGEVMEFLLTTGEGEPALARADLGLQYQLSESSVRELMGMSEEPVQAP